MDHASREAVYNVTKLQIPKTARNNRVPLYRGVGNKLQLMYSAPRVTNDEAKK